MEANAQLFCLVGQRLGEHAAIAGAIRKQSETANKFIGNMGKARFSCNASVAIKKLEG